MNDLSKYSTLIVFVLSSVIAMAAYYIHAEDEKLIIRTEAKLQILRLSIDSNTTRLDRLVTLLENKHKLN